LHRRSKEYRLHSKHLSEALAGRRVMRLELDVRAARPTSGRNPEPDPEFAIPRS